MKSAPQCGSVRFCSPIVRPTSCYASTNRRSRQATYQAVCCKRATLLSNGDQSRRMGGTGQAAGMLRGQQFGPGGNTTPDDRWAASASCCERLCVSSRSITRRRLWPFRNEMPGDNGDRYVQEQSTGEGSERGAKCGRSRGEYRATATL